MEQNLISYLYNDRISIMKKGIKQLTTLILVLVVMCSFSQCSGTRSLDKKAPVKFENPYYQSWVAGVEGGGSGINVFLPLKEKNSELDSIYFRGQSAKLEWKQEAGVYVGRFNSELNRKNDMILSSDPMEEYGNQLPVVKTSIPFELRDDECVISYQKRGKTRYFKLEGLVEKAAIPYPSAPPVKQ